MSGLLSSMRDRWVRSVLSDRELTATAVLAGVAIVLNMKDGICSMFCAEPAADIQRAKITVQHGVLELEQRGWLKITRHQSGPGVPNDFELAADEYARLRALFLPWTMLETAGEQKAGGSQKYAQNAHYHAPRRSFQRGRLPVNAKRALLFHSFVAALNGGHAVEFC